MSPFLSSDQSRKPKMEGVTNVIIPLRELGREEQDEKIDHLAGLSKGSDRGFPGWRSPALARVLHTVLDKTDLDSVGSGYGGAKVPYIEFKLNKLSREQAKNIVRQMTEEDFARGISFSIGEKHVKDEEGNVKTERDFGFYLRGKKPSIEQVDYVDSQKKLSYDDFQAFVRGKPTSIHINHFFNRINEMLLNCKDLQKAGIEPTKVGEGLANVIECIPRAQIGNWLDYFNMYYTNERGTNTVVAGEFGNSKINYDEFGLDDIATADAFKLFVGRIQTKYLDDSTKENAL